MILVHFLKHIGSDFLNIVPLNDTISSNNNNNGFSLESLGLQNLQYFLIMGAIGSFAIYFLIGGFIHVIIIFFLICNVFIIILISVAFLYPTKRQGT